MILQRLPRTMIVTAERVRAGDVVFGYMIDDTWIMLDDATAFTVSHVSHVRRAYSQRINGIERDGMDAFFMTGHDAQVLIEDKGK